MTNLVKLTSILFAMVFIYATPGVDAETGELYFIDAHSQVGKREVLKKIVPLMDQAGIKRVILSGRRKIDSQKIAKFAANHPDRIIPAVRTKSGAYIKNKQKYYDTLNRDASSGRFGAMAELLLYHAKKGSKGSKAPEVVVYPKDRRIQTALKKAIKNEWPLVVHIEFRRLGRGEAARFMQELKALFDKHPEHPFVMIHMAQLDAESVEKLIEEHANVYFMTSHANTIAVHNSRQPWTNMFNFKKLAPEWKKLVVNYPDRFVLAFDNVWDYHWGDSYLQQAEIWRNAFKDLPHEVAHAIAHGNAERLWKIPTE